jgi:hypothetical protein
MLKSHILFVRHLVPLTPLKNVVTAHNTTVDKIFFVINNRHEGGHYILVSTQQEFSAHFNYFNQLLLVNTAH